MEFKVKITEICEGFVWIEAESREAAVKLVEEEYFKNPNDYYLEPCEVDFE